MKILFGLMLIAVSIFNINPAYAQKDFSGRWVSLFEEDLSFELILTQDGDSVKGLHCGMTANATRIDCMLEEDGEYSLTGILKGDMVDATFQSAYSMTYGKAEIFKYGDYIYWEIKEAPEGEFFLPVKAILKKVK